MYASNSPGRDFGEFSQANKMISIKFCNRKNGFYVSSGKYFFWVWQPDRTGLRLFPTLISGVTVAPRCKLHKSVIFHFEEEGKGFQVNT